MLTTANPHTAVCLALTRAISKARAVDEIYTAALDALAAGLGVERSSILLFDPDGVMRFKASRSLSETYRRAVEGHTPWTPDSRDPEPIVVANVAADPGLASYMATFEAEQIAALTFIPLVSLDRVVGKFMLYFPVPHAPSPEDLQLAEVIAAQVAFAVERTRTEQQARRNETRLRFALDAASMGTWDWDLTTNEVVWSDNLERIHGLPAGAFDGTFESYAKEIHPDDRERVFASVHGALEQGAPHDVEYRLVAPDGTIRWCEGKGRVEYQDGRPTRMSGVCVMVTRRKEAELTKLAAVEEASRLKDDFLATLSHEMRTPLNAIVGWIQMLHDGGLPPDRARHAIDVIARNARLQAQLIEDILDVSRIITGKLELDRGAVSMRQLVETAVAGVAPGARARQITLSTSIDAELPPIEGDARRLHQVLNNVLSNALKFTPDHGSIVLECAREADRVRMSITDTGVGIAPEFLPYVFDRFRQADSRSTRRHGGLGLGLAIARYLVELHGGDIAARSEGPDRGTTVTILLPGGPVMEAGPIVAASDGSAFPALAGREILVVEDQNDSRELLVTLLEQRGARVFACESAVRALELLASRAVDLVIADLAMPDMDGYELVRQLRTRGIATPAMAVTAYARADDRHRAITSGYSAFCTKPIDGEELLRTAGNLLARG